MRHIHLTVLLASALVLSWPVAAQTTAPSGTATPAPGAVPQQDRQQLCDGVLCEDPDQQRDLQKLHAQDLEWMDSYGPATGGGSGNAQGGGQRGPGNGAGAGAGRGTGGAGGQGQGPR